MSDSDERQQSRLIDRLSATTLRLRNLFYLNLLLAGAVIFLVLQDPAFVSEKITPALATLQPILKLEKGVKASDVVSFNYQREVLRTYGLIEKVSAAFKQRFQALPQDESEQIVAALEDRLTEGQFELLEFLVDYEAFAAKREILGRLFSVDLESVDYQHLAGFAVFLIYADSLAEALQKGREAVLLTDDLLPGEFADRRALEEQDLRLIDLRYFVSEAVRDSVLQNQLDDLPPGDAAFHALVIIETFCQANAMGNCSVAEIRQWQEERAGDASSKLSAPGLEVNLARDIVVPAAPLVLLVAYHIYAMQFRRRQALRQRLLPLLSALRLNLLDEAWILNGLVLNIQEAEGAWRKVQSLLMTLFLFLGQAAPLIAVLVAGYYSTKQILIGAFIVEEFVTNIEFFTGALEAIGVESLPAAPVPPGFFWEYLWIAVAAFSALLMLGSLFYLLRDQVLEIRDAWTGIEQP